jgi:hypothetical protein
VEVANISTPQTIEHWLAAEKGEIGIRKKLSMRALSDGAVQIFCSVISSPERRRDHNSNMGTNLVLCVFCLGAAVGIDVTPKRFTDQTVLRQLDVVTPIPNLFMTGQDTVLCGVTLCQVTDYCARTRVTLARGLSISQFVQSFLATPIRVCISWLILKSDVPAAGGCDHRLPHGGLLRGREHRRPERMEGPQQCPAGLNDMRRRMWVMIQGVWPMTVAAPRPSVILNCNSALRCLGKRVMETRRFLCLSPTVSFNYLTNNWHNVYVRYFVLF